MWQEAFETLKREYDVYRAGTEEFTLNHKALIEAHDALAERLRELEKLIDDHNTSAHGHASPDKGHIEHGVAIPANGSLGSEAMETIYRYVIDRAKNDPGILELLLKKPELRVKVERQTIQVNGETLRGQLALLIKKGFFDVPKNGNTAFNELQRLGKKVGKPNMYRELDGLAEMGFLTKEDGGFQAVPEMKVEIVKA